VYLLVGYVEKTSSATLWLCGQFESEWGYYDSDSSFIQGCNGMVGRYQGDPDSAIGLRSRVGTV